MADNIRLVTFAGSTVTPQDDALVYETAINQNGIISGGAITLKKNNTLHIAAGHGIICGRKFTIVESDITVLLTTGDTHFGRAYIHLDLSNTTDPIQILTETGSALSAPIQQPDVNISNGIYEIDLVTFTIDALTISDLVDLRPTVEKIMDIINELKNGLDNAKVDTLTTMEQVKASTDKSKPVGAGAVEELSDSLVADIYVGDDGKLHKVQGGADSVIPFKSNEGYWFEPISNFTLNGGASVTKTSTQLKEVKGIFLAFNYSRRYVTFILKDAIKYDGSTFNINVVSLETISVTLDYNNKTVNIKSNDSGSCTVIDAYFIGFN